MLCALKNFVKDHTSQSAGAGITVSIFNLCIDATVRTREVPLVHATCDVITLSRTRNCFTQYLVYSLGEWEIYFVEAPRIYDRGMEFLHVRPTYLSFDCDIAEIFGSWFQQ